MRGMTTPVWLGTVFTGAALLTGCSSTGGADVVVESAEHDGGMETGLLIVASTDVYSALADEVVGEAAEVEAIVDNPAVDPHSYEATPQDRLLVQEADVLIANGGGYDPYITQLASADDKEDAVFQLIPGENWHSHEFDGSYENEHIWYDLSRMEEFVLDFAEHMGDLDSQNADFYRENAEQLAQEIAELNERNHAIDTEGLSYLATEAVSGFLLQDAGFDDLTELEFLAAVEHGDDVPPRLFFDAVDMVSTGEADLLAYNSQTETQQSRQIRESAQENSVAVLEFNETLPEGVESYTEWMEQNVEAVESLVISLAQ